MAIQANLLGFGTMGRQVAACLDCLGYEVRVWTRAASPERLRDYALDRRIFVRKTGLDRPGGSVTFVPELISLRPTLTFEALAEDLDLKRRVWSSLPYGPGPTVDLFTNSSSFRPSEIAPGVQGLHFFNPLHTLRIIETTADAAALSAAGRTLLADLGAAGFEIIRTESNRGYIGNYILFREIGSAFKLVDDHGYRSATIDAVLAKMGRSSSLFDIVDLVGVDVTHRILLNLQADDAAVHVSPKLAAALEAGILGRKNRTSIRSVVDAPVAAGPAPRR